MLPVSILRILTASFNCIRTVVVFGKLIIPAARRCRSVSCVTNSIIWPYRSFEKSGKKREELAGFRAKSGSGSHLMIRTHQQGIFKTFISSRSDFPMPLRSSAIPESPNVSQTRNLTLTQPCWSQMWYNYSRRIYWPAYQATSHPKFCNLVDSKTGSNATSVNRNQTR